VENESHARRGQVRESNRATSFSGTYTEAAPFPHTIETTEFAARRYPDIRNSNEYWSLKKKKKS
jgi:hypothetical protein